MKTYPLHKATHIQGPNFAYALVLRRFSSFKVSPSFNLSSLQHIFNAAEPISVEVAKQFIKTFSAYGLSREAMTGGYGLAESCVYVSDDGHGVLTIDRDAFEKENHVIPLSYYNCITDSNTLSNSSYCNINSSNISIIFITPYFF